MGHPAVREAAVAGCAASEVERAAHRGGRPEGRLPRGHRGKLAQPPPRGHLREVLAPRRFRLREVDPPRTSARNSSSRRSAMSTRSGRRPEPEARRPSGAPKARAPLRRSTRGYARGVRRAKLGAHGEAARHRGEGPRGLRTARPRGHRREQMHRRPPGSRRTSSSSRRLAASRGRSRRASPARRARRARGAARWGRPRAAVAARTPAEWRRRRRAVVGRVAALLGARRAGRSGRLTLPFLRLAGAGSTSTRK